MPGLEHSILKAVAYFNLFDYPITVEEIKSFLDRRFDEGEFDTALKQLTDNGHLFKLKEYYSLANDLSLVYKREASNSKAVDELIRARKIASFVYSFPFVKGVGISGSLSKNCANEKSDLDFFIITKANRLWIARTLLHLYYRITLSAAKRQMICLNYFIDEVALDIPEKNFYTAIEIATLIPCEGADTMHRFFTANKWYCNFFPNYNKMNNSLPRNKSITVKFLEWILDNNVVNVLDSSLMSYFKKRWKKLFDKNIYMESGSRKGACLVNKHYCKQMPDFLQQKILKRFEAALTELKEPGMKQPSKHFSSVQ